MAQLEGKVAIITGAAAGIGFATARVMAERGASVVLTGTRVANVEAAAESLRGKGYRALALPLDLADPKSITTLIDTVVQRFGRLDILHNNASDLSVTRRDQNVETMDTEVWDRVFLVNVRGTMLCCKHALPHMVRQQGGSIINTASALGLQGADVQAAYAASKAAVMQLSRSIATSHGKHGIRCNAIVPGLIATEGAQQNLPPPLWKIQESENLVPYVGKADDIAYTVAFLASDEARYITGQSILVDGGAAAHISGMAQLRALGPPPG
ncbi:MAG TPA: SDR family NAD(P)-dependent oxidoreductase [Steroidobacteraceae bacterium]|nr:SDR family NAD(P)-dependent oxidoreductase [Steroidobacteraceae bacterium]